MSAKPGTLDFHGPLVRTDDYQTSNDAADEIMPHLSNLQVLVLLTIACSPEGASDQMLEGLDQFRDCSESTVRKRRCDLVAAGMVNANGTTANIRPRGREVTRWAITDRGLEFLRSIE